MSRVPCSICGLEILPATAERNDGLCGRCAKGTRPCIFCGRHVSEPLKDGIWAHIECFIKKRQAEESLGWRTAGDINWQWIRELLRSALRRLFNTAAIDLAGTTPVKLCIYVQVEDFIDLSVHQIQSDGSKKRISNSDWGKELAPLDSSFSVLHEKLSDEEKMKLSENMQRSLADILSDECKELEKHNFIRARTVPISWAIQCA